MRRAALTAAAMTGLAGLTVAALTAAAQPPARAAATPGTTTPIKHVIVIIGENHSFDNVFATYQPPAGQHVRNLLSEGIVTAGGGAGPNAGQAAQLTASDTGTYSLSPRITGRYRSLPQPSTTSVAPGCDGLPGNSPDARFPANLPNQPFQITKYVRYDDDHSGDSGGCEFDGAFVGDSRTWPSTTRSATTTTSP